MLEDFEAALTKDTHTRRRHCGFTQWVETLSEEDRDVAVALVENRSYNCRQLARYFQTKGAPFNDQVLNRHRNRSCCGQGQ